MLAELRVTQLGVIEDVTVVFGPGLTALTGETGAGKTLLVDAIDLLTGAPADPSLVRPGAKEAVVEARFSWPDAQPGSSGPGSAGRETILTRVIPSAGRSRGYIDGRMVSAAQLAECGRSLVDLHGQHAHQSLLSPNAQRRALDRAGDISTADVTAARRHLKDIKEAQATLGGDSRARAREIDLLSYQLEEMDRAGLQDPDEDTKLQEEEEALADATGLRHAAAGAWEALNGDDGIVDRLGLVVATLAGRKRLGDLHARLHSLQEELSDAASDALSMADVIDDDQGRLAAVGARRHILTELRRKYGDSLAQVIAYRDDLRDRLLDMARLDERAAGLEAERVAAEKDLAAQLEQLWLARRAAAPVLAEAVQSRLQELAMPRARFSVEVGSEPGSELVGWLIGANPGEPLLPLTKVASGGELARTMLATRLAIGAAGRLDGPEAGPSTLVFDEVDAGVGGEAAVSVGRALAALAPEHQVLVVTHLPQVAAFAQHQLVVQKSTAGDRTVAVVHEVDGSDRVVELARMLSGSPGSDTARVHAAELLSQAQTAAS